MIDKSYLELRDVPGECNARVYLRDEFEDERIEIRCRLPAGHEGEHRVECHTVGNALIVWDTDEADPIHKYIWD